MAFSFELKLAISPERYGAISAGPEHSLIETAKENDLDPYCYLVWLLNNAPGLSQTDEAWAEAFSSCECAPGMKDPKP